MGFNGFIQLIVWTITLGVICSGQFYNTRPYPTYSLENMPKTGFTCRDKILGGYYADPETQCQMFHVCVKVAGVGTQDYRFLCPNSTAFDQEAQICADWGDIDCEASTLYYGSDNFDLYRIGSNFDSNKRAPYADEEEATFHLQRAETNDARRSKQVVVDQYTNSENALIQHANSFRGNTNQSPVFRSTQTPRQERIYTENTTPAAINRQSIAANYNYNQNVKTSPAVGYTTTTTTARTVLPVTVQIQTNSNNNNYVKESQKQQNFNNQNNNDEIFQRSQSSHFYNNRNNGKEDYDEEFIRKTTTTTTSRPQTRGGRGRSRGNVRANNINGIFTDSKRTYNQDATTTTTTTTTPRPQYNAENVQPARVRNNYNQFIHPTTPTSTSTTSSPERFYDAYNTALQLQQQQQLAVQHYKNFPPSTTINPAELKKPAVIEEEVVSYEARPSTTSPVNTQYYNTNRNQQTFQNQNSIKSATPSSTYAPVDFIPDQPTTENLGLTPRGFSKSPNDEEGAFNQYQVSPKTYLEKYQTLNRRNNGNENYTPASAHKKFSTLVPKDQYTPTTFKPNTYKKPIEAISKAKQEKLFAPRFNPDSYFAAEPTTQRNASPTPIPYTTTTTTITSRLQPYVNTENIDEDDGQYHPELYEKDFAKNKIGQKQRTNTRAPNYNSNVNNNFNNNNNYNNNNNNNNNYQAPVSSSSAEEEFLKTEHSQNIAASKLQTLTQQSQKINNNPLYDNKSTQKTVAPVEQSRPLQQQTRPVQQVKLVPQPQTKIISNAPTISPYIKTTKKPVQKEKDASYDYAYYDTGNSRDYSEYELIEEFGKTAKKLNKN